MTREDDYNVGEVIFSSTKTLIQKGTRKSDSTAVIIKKSTETVVSITTVESFKKDYQYTKMLHQENSDYFINMLDIVELSNGAFMLVEEDEGLGLENLLQEKKKFDTKEFLTLANDMALCLQHAHSKQVLHRDIKLANFIFSKKNNKPKLIDFGLSTIVTRKRPSVSCTAPIGTFHYMPPEQTGRVAKNVDFRSDIYSLGISFYELLTGKLPFEGDKLALVHSQITKKLPNIQGVPDALNKIIQKMCSKNPSERYFSASGVVYDLQFLSENLEKIPENFKIGQHDVKDFQIPNKLYGRDDELKLLKKTIVDHFSNMCLVSGYSGMGKSRLIEELMKDQELDLLMSYGKFDQFNRSTPFSGFLSIIKSLTTRAISEKNSDKKSNIISSLKLNLKEFGGVIAALVPEVEMLIGKKPTVEPLSSIKDTEERLFDTFFKFFDAFTIENTLVLVVDDLQWSDASSFLFLQKFLSSKNEKIFIIGAYRDNEVGTNHPLMNIINEHKDIHSINIQPLKLKDLNEMVAETLHSNMNETMPLSELIFKKTGGNPFFSREFINTLYEEELIKLQGSRWTWETDKVEKMNYSSNVIDFMIQNLQKKSNIIQKLLNRASCIGNTFKIEELNFVWDEVTNVQDLLIEPVKEGWLFQLNSNEYQFFHDRLQQASYELFKKEEREKIHLMIGNLFLKEFKKHNDVENNIFKIINHLNIAKSRFENLHELIHLNILAAKKSLENSASAESLSFSKIAMELSPKDLWESDYPLAFELHFVHAKSSYANYLLDEAEEQYDLLLKKAVGKFDIFTVYSSYMRMAALKFNFNKAYDLFVESLKMFDLTKDIIAHDVGQVYVWTLTLKGKITQEFENIGGAKNIVTAKKCQDRELNLFMDILLESLDVIFLASNANPLMFITGALISLYLYLVEGLPHGAPVGVAIAGWIYSFFFKEPTGYVLTTAAEVLHSKEKSPKYNVVCLQYILAVGSITGGSYQKQQFHLNTAINYAMTHGEYLYGAYSINSIPQGLNGEHFPTLIPKMKKRQKWVLEIKNYFAADFLEVMINYACDLAGVSKYNPQFSIPTVRKLKCGDSTLPTVEGILHFHKGLLDEALALFDEAEPVGDNSQGLFDFYERRFYHCLTLIAFYKNTKDEKYSEKIKKCIEEFKIYADLGTEYLYPKYRLMEVYFQSTQPNQNNMKILSLFEEVYALMTKNGLVIPSAVASECALEYCVENEFPVGICKTYFSNTMKIWSGLAAKTKTDQLKKKYFKYSSGFSHRGSSTSLTTSVTKDSESVHFASESLDMMSIIKASQALSVELTISSLIDKVMHIIIENTGAEIGGLFLVGKEGEYAEASIKNGTVTMIHKLTTSLEENELYCSVLLIMAKTLKKPVIINDVSESEYAHNEYLEREGIKSICIHPIFKGKKYIGSIYLENKSLEGIFDEERKEILDHISSQLAISYENAKLYDDMNSLNASYERFLPKEFLKQLGKGDVRNVKKGDAATKKICVLFSDIRSFTEITEKMNPEESFSFVNEILSYLAPIISKHNGFIDKFFGDCIMALFPYEVDDSVKCGHEMLSALKVYNQECRKNLEPVKIGIGIHYGDVMIGTIGDEERIDATVISDTVNTASRVESLTKTLGSTFVVTEDVLQNTKFPYKNRYVGKYLLKGKQVPMSLFHMITDDEKSVNVEEFTSGIQNFESGNFQKAEEIFKSLDDKTSNYLQHVAKKYGYYSFNNDWAGEIKIDKDGNLVDLENKLSVEKKIDNLSDEEKTKIINDLLSNNGNTEILKVISKQIPDKMAELLKEF